MLKSLFTSTTRVKLLNLFLMNPEKEYFVRELTRLLDEQINSIRRELDNLKKIGLLKSKARNRRKFYVVNSNFLLFKELRSMFVKAGQSSESLVKNIIKMGEVDFLLVSGAFLGKQSPVDLLLVGELERTQLEKFLDKLDTEEPIKFSILTKEDFLYRIKCRDQFILDLVQDEENIVGVNKLDVDFQ